MASSTKQMNVSAGTAQAVVNAMVSDGMPNIPCPDPAGYRYVGARYVPKFADPAEWSSANTYEPLTIVMHEGNSFTSKQFVPVGIDIENEDYWAETGNYNSQVEQYRQEVLAIRASAVYRTPTVATMVADAKIENGMTVMTAGYHTAGDGGSAVYTVAAGLTANGIDIIALDNGLFAKASGQLNMLQLGAQKGIDCASILARSLDLYKRAFFPAGSYALSTIEMGNDEHIEGEYSYIVQLESTAPTIDVQGVDCSLEKLIIVGGTPEVNGINIGGDDHAANNIFMRDVEIQNVKGDGIYIDNANNFILDNIIVLNCTGNGIHLKEGATNINGGTIRAKNIYGCGECGAILCGEGNFFDICSQSNTSDNIKLNGWMNGSFLNAYTEYSENGYELNIAGNCFSNVIMGVYRSNTDKQYLNNAGTYNLLLFSNTNNIANSSSTQKQWMPFIDELEVKNLYCGNSKISSGSTVNNVSICISGDSSTTTLDGLFNGCDRFCAPCDFTINTLNLDIKEPITSNIMQVQIDNVTKSTNTIYQFNNETVDGDVSPITNPLAVSKGDILKVKIIGFGPTLPASNHVSLVGTAVMK